MLVGMIAANEAPGAFWLEFVSRVTVGGKSTSGAMTITSVTATKNNPTNLPKRFTATNLRFAAICLSNREKLASLSFTFF
jgi:hypothetical protein